MGEDVLSKIKSLVGYESEFSDDQPIEEGMIRRFCDAIDDRNPLYRDREVAGKTVFDGIVAPPTFVCEWNHHEALWVDETGGYIGKMQLPKRLMRATNDFEFIEPLRPGDKITTRTKITEVYEKQGSLGRMIFIGCESFYSNQEGKPLAIQRSTFIVIPEQ